MNSLLKASFQDDYSDLSFCNSKNNINSSRKKPYKINLEYKQLTKSIETLKILLKKIKKLIKKNNFISS